MARKYRKILLINSCALLVSILTLGSSLPGIAGGIPLPKYGAETDQLLWFVQTSDTHIGMSGSTDANRLQWLVTEGLSTIAPSFIIVTGDLTDSTSGNWLGMPDGPHQEEWDEYKAILSGVSPNIYYDIPGNHDAYSDADFSYYLDNSIHGQATGNTQASITRLIGSSKYLFLGINTAGKDGAPFSIFAPYGDNAGLDSNELAFITQEMNTHSDAKLTLVFGHHPLFNTGDSTDTYVHEGIDQFMSLMDTSYSSLYGYGHTHDFSEGFFVPNDPSYKGFFYLNVASLAKSAANQYAIMAIDHDGFSSKVHNIGTWPAVLITAPLDFKLGVNNPYTYSVPISASNPIRALVFDKAPISAVQYRIDSGATWYSMNPVSGNSHLWQGTWNASSLAQGSHTVEVKATSSSGTSNNDVITVNLTGAAPTLKVGATFNEIGKYVTSRKTGTSFVQGTSFKQGDRVVFRMLVQDSNGSPVSGATVNLSISGPINASTSAVSGSNGIAEASWATSAPNKRGAGGTLTGSYTAVVTNVIDDLLWDGISKTQIFSLSAR